MTPKEYVNQFYQPLGYLNCQVSSKKMWEYSKECAVNSIKETISILREINQSPLALLTTRINNLEKFITEIENL